MTRNIIAAFVALLLCSAASNTFAKVKKQKDAGDVVKWQDVPANVQTTIQKNAGSGKVVDVHKQAKNAAVIYRAEVKGTDGKFLQIAVNENGTLIKVQPDNGRNKRKHKPLFGSVTARDRSASV